MVVNGLLLMKAYILHMSILHLILNTVMLTLPIIHLPLLIILLLPNIVKHYSSCDDVDNRSHPYPIVLSLNIDVYQTIHSPVVHISRKQWNRASESDKSIYIEMNWIIMIIV